MNRSNVHLLDLPDEILLFICKKLNNIQVLYSLLDVNNGRLNSLVQENIFTDTLKFASTDEVSLIDRFCADILPRVGPRVKRFVLDPVWMERILLVADYPNLTELQIGHFRQQVAESLFTSESSLRSIFQHRITSLILVNDDNQETTDSLKTYTTNVYSHILNFFKNLTNLTIVQPSLMFYPGLSLVRLSSTAFASSILTHLDINVNTFDDCLCLLDGRLKQLMTLSVIVYSMDIESSSARVQQKNHLPQLQCFSLKSFYGSEEYENVVLLLRRMVSLNRLTLYLCVKGRNRVIDGTCVQHEILDYLPELYSFTFYIGTGVDTTGSSNKLSSEKIQRTLANTRQDVASMVNYTSADSAVCSIFSLPFAFDCLRQVGNNFPNLIFSYVTFLLIEDVDPFRHEFFVRTMRSFPLLKHLRIYNVESPFWTDQNPLLSTKSHPCSVIEYPHLTTINLSYAHRDYAELFLNETRAYVPCLTDLGIADRHLKTITQNFTREETRRNCVKIKRLFTLESVERSGDLDFYFPSLEVCRTLF